MSLIKWKEDFSVGVAEADHEHQELMEMINVLHRSVDEGVTRKQVMEGLGDIFAQIAAHFALEERFMQESHYRGYLAHKEDHEALLDDLRDIIEEVEDDGEYDEARLSIDLDRWFSDHFRDFDAPLHHQHESH